MVCDLKTKPCPTIKVELVPIQPSLKCRAVKHLILQSKMAAFSVSAWHI